MGHPRQQTLHPNPILRFTALCLLCSVLLKQTKIQNTKHKLESLSKKKDLFYRTRIDKSVEITFSPLKLAQ